MFQSMEECTNFIFQLKASMFKGEPLQSAKIILNGLGNPHTSSKYIHLAGSNGKGSTLNATREILITHGLRVGAFTSPHLVRANERITINHVEITDEQFLLYANRLADVVNAELDGQFPSFFEVVTIIALQYFADAQVDVVLLETGIGGRLDATNVVRPEVSIITTISLEHTEMLGDTHALIAAEKAGIIKQGKPVVIGVKNVEAQRVIKEKADKVAAPTYILDENLVIERTAQGTFHYGAIRDITLAMEGSHQVNNAALAIKASELFLGKLQPALVKKALGQARWNGRFERICERVIIDGAHNSEGTAALIATLQQVAPKKRYHFVYAALKDKDHYESIALMDAVAHKIYFTQIALPRAAMAEQLAAQSHAKQVQVEIDWKICIEKALSELTEQDLLIITGSLYFIGEVRPHLLVKEVLQ